ncbi:hypothetical protein MHYP_G00179550 [Metynnis hypsauchen]
MCEEDGAELAWWTKTLRSFFTATERCCQIFSGHPVPRLCSFIHVILTCLYEQTLEPEESPVFCFCLHTMANGQYSTDKDSGLFIILIFVSEKRSRPEQDGCSTMPCFCREERREGGRIRACAEIQNKMDESVITANWIFQLLIQGEDDTVRNS